MLTIQRSNATSIYQMAKLTGIIALTHTLCQLKIRALELSNGRMSVWRFLLDWRAKHELFANLFGENLLILICRRFAWHESSCSIDDNIQFSAIYPMVVSTLLLMAVCSDSSILNGSNDGYKHAVAVCRICDKTIIPFHGMAWHCMELHCILLQSAISQKSPYNCKPLSCNCEAALICGQKHKKPAQINS